MALFQWNSNFVTDLPTVDQQHHHLVDLINNLGERLARNEVNNSDLEALFGQLIDYADYHFSEEEAMMRRVGIDSRHYDRHAETHRRFLEELELLKTSESSDPSKIAPELLDYLAHWLTYHILAQDQDMARQIHAIESGMNPVAAFDAEERQSNHDNEPLLTALKALLAQLSSRNRELVEINSSLEARVAERTRELIEANRKLKALSLEDVLTGLSNRRHAMMQLETLCADSRETGQPLCAVMIDADHFKEVNDVHGHDAGDLVLKALANTLKHSLRTDDSVFRLGGDEFLVLCPATGFDGGMQLAHKLLENVQRLNIELGDGRWLGSASIGVATSDGVEAGCAQLLKSADRALYRSKKAGRGCVRASSDARDPANHPDSGKRLA